jgi:hypothetical protein
MPLFSIVIPTFNRAKLIGATLESVFAQSFNDFEVIVVDDGSVDQTEAAIVPWRDRLTLLKQDNQGPGPARNLGARHARGEYLCFLDSDDLWLPWTLAYVKDLLERFDRPSLIASMPMAFRDAGDVASTNPPGIDEAVEQYSDYLAADPISIFPGAGAMVVRADAFAHSGGFASTRMGAEDAELFLRLGTEPGFVFVRKPVLVAYRMHPGSFSIDVDAGLKGRWELIRLERESRFPGGAQRERDRIGIIASHCRSGSIVALRAGKVGEALRLYRASAGWQLRLGRWKYLLALPVLAIRAAVRGRTAEGGQGFLPASCAPAAGEIAQPRAAGAQPMGTGRAAVVEGSQTPPPLGSRDAPSMQSRGGIGANQGDRDGI